MRALVEPPAGYGPLLAPKLLSQRAVIAFAEIQHARHPGSIGFGAAVPRPARSPAYASPNLFPGTAQGWLPARAGSPLAGQDSHLLDDERSFMVASPPPIPFDPQGLVALDVLSALTADDTTALEPSAELLARFQPALLPFTDRLSGPQSFFSTRKLQQVVGWQHHTSWRRARR